MNVSQEFLDTQDLNLLRSSNTPFQIASSLQLFDTLNTWVPQNEIILVVADSKFEQAFP